MASRKKTDSKKKTTYKTAWDFGLFYKNAEDPRIEHDVRAAEKACAAFAKEFAGTHFTDEHSSLLKALSAYEKLCAMPEFERPMRYFGYRKEIDAKDSAAEKMLNKLSDRLTKAGNLLVFFDLALGAISKDQQEKILADEKFLPYRYYLARAFLNAKYNLTEPEEKILNLKSLPASQLWVAGTEKILNQKIVRHKGKDLPLMEALNLVSTLPKKERHALWDASIEVIANMADIAENEMNAVVLNKKINDELRGYAKPYSATVIGNENSERSIEALVSAVTDRFDISGRFYKLKASMLGEKKLRYPDKSAPYGKKITIPFDQAVDTLREVFYKLNNTYGSILDQMLERGQIDVYPKKGKSGGAFCASGVNQPTMVLLNQVDDMHSLTTFAHEMGHAVHAERSKEQPVLYQGHSTATAETASTLFENLVFESLLAQLPEKERITALHGKISDEVSTIMRQIAFFNYERELHETIRKEGSMTKEEMAALLRTHLKAYLGSHVDVSEKDGYSFVYVPHFRMFFYVYTYAYGSLVSNVLSERWKQDASYITKIDEFLTAGASASPEDIFKNAGLRTDREEFFTAGLSALERKVLELERLVKKQKRA
jgi:oligoendopeptidase F